MHTVKLSTDRSSFSFQIPEKQEEMQEAWYQAIGPMLLLADSPELKSHVLCTLMKMQLRQKMRIWAKAKMQPWQVLGMTELLRWMWSREVESAHDEVKAWIDSFQHEGITYLLPEPSFNDFNMDEWAHVDTHLLLLSHYPDQAEHHLLNLTATICRPAKHQDSLLSEDYDGYPRIAFNPETVSRRYQALKDVPEHVKAAVLDYCLRGRSLLAKRYAVLFDGESSEGPGFGWKGLMLNVAESGTFGSERQVKQTNLHEVLIYCSKKRIEMQQREAEIEEARMRAEMRGKR